MKNLVFYDGYNLNNLKCHVRDGDPRSLPNQNVRTQSIARQDGAIKVSENFTEKRLKFNGIIKDPSGSSISFRDVQNEFDLALSQPAGTLRMVRNYKLIDYINASDNWSVSDDATNLSTDTSTFQFQLSSLSFDVDVSASGNNYATLSNSALTAVDLSSVEDTGNFDFMVYIPDAENLTGITFRIGSGSGDYWEEVVSEDWTGDTLHDGWNPISVYWPTMDETGSPDASAVDFALIRISYTSSYVDETGFRANGLYWTDEDDLENYECTIESLDMAEGTAFIDYQPFKMVLNANRSIAVGTHQLALRTVNSRQSASKDIELEFDGTYDPSPTLQFTIGTAGGITDLTYWNLTTDEQMTVSTAFDDGDILRINTETLTCLLNGGDKDFAGVFPKHVIGNNKANISYTVPGGVTISQTDFNNSEAATIISGTDGETHAQSFQATATGVLTKVSLYLFSSGSRSPISIEVVEDDGGEPGSTVLGGAGTFIDNTPTWRDFSINGSVTNGSTYWIVIRSYLKLGEYLYWTVAQPSVYVDGTFADGLGTVSGGFITVSSWTNSNQDGTFKAYITPSTNVDYDANIFYTKKFI